MDMLSSVAGSVTGENGAGGMMEGLGANGRFLSFNINL